MDEKLITVENIHKRFPIHSGILGREKAAVHAVRGVSLSINRGETLGLVGESGCGKTTLGMLMLRLIDADHGLINFDGKDITHMSRRKMRDLRNRMQIIFQDPQASLNPRMSVGDIIGEPLLIHKIAKKTQRKERVMELLRLVGISDYAYGKYPHEFSGGQRQRIGIARAIALMPSLIVADEPVSALDISVRGGILNLLCDLRDKFSLSYLFIAHDLKIVEQISHRIAVMYLGKIVEIFSADGLALARHPYTQALASAVPTADTSVRTQRIILRGDAPSQISPPAGCSFHTRCPYARDLCRTEEPELLEYKTGFFAACHFISEMNEKTVYHVAPAMHDRQ